MSQTPDFYIFNQFANCFYRIVEISDWQVAKVSLDKLHAATVQAYEACNATLAMPPHKPTEQQRAAMTSSLHWIQEVATSPAKYQLTLKFDPKHNDTAFIPCFSHKIESWFSDFDKKQAHTGYMGLLYIGIFLVAAAVICGTGFFLYQKYKSSRSDPWRQSLLGTARKTQTTKEEDFTASANSSNRDYEMTTRVQYQTFS